MPKLNLPYYKDKNLSQDAIVEMNYIGGFEWPWVLIITNKSKFHEFEERNCIMRAMSRLVILRTDAIYPKSPKRPRNPQENNLIGSKRAKTDENISLEPENNYFSSMSQGYV